MLFAQFCLFSLPFCQILLACRTFDWYAPHVLHANRLNKIKHQTTGIVLQPSKSQNSIRTIPLLSETLQDLQGWRQLQQQDTITAEGAYIPSGFLVTNPLGGVLYPALFWIITKSCWRLRHFTFHAVHHAFATRALEQGMDAKTLSVLLGYYSVAFTYAHVLDNHKRENMSLLAGLFQAQVF